MTLDQIISLAEEKGVKYLVCKRCTDGYCECYSHIQAGICYRCNGTGKVLNKWGQIKQGAEALKKNIAIAAEGYKTEEQRIREEYSEKRVERALARMNRRKDMDREGFRAAIKALNEEIAK